MRINSVSHRRVRLFIAVFLIVSCLTLSSYCVSAHTDPDLEAYVDYNLGKTDLNNKQGLVNTEKIELKYLKTVRDNIVSELGANTEDQRENLRAALGASMDLSPGSAAAAFIDETEDTLDGIKLKARFDDINASIETYVTDNIDPLFEGDEDESVAGYDDLYAQHETQYNNLSAYYKKKADLIANGGKESGSEGMGLYGRIEQPTADTFGVYQCPNPSGRCYGYYKSADEHKNICPHKHGMDGTTNKVWWGCFASSCTHSAEHWIECRALCGDFFPPPTPSIIPVPDTIGYSVTYTYHDHEAVCEVPVYKNFIVGTRPCGRKYFTCQVGCRHGVEEGYFSNSTSFSAYYGTYRAEVVYNDPIKEVYWYFQKPGGSMKQVSHDTSGGKTSSWSHTFGSTSGTYKVKAKVYFKGSRSAITHERKVYVY
ncbi:hypothetical protein F4225_02195 [Candidatus Poribacteria bacterium]|nr:hypothetical protein [Candidatus Poribacteria bacterium]